MANELNDYALVIGINDYPFYGQAGRLLHGAIHDAQAVGAWLTDKEIGGGLPDDNCKLIVSSTNTADPPQPRRNKIDDALGDIWQTVEERAKGGEQPRRFYFYFSGHGQAQLTEDVALCMPNWAKNRQAAALSFRKYMGFIVDCLGFREVVMLMDCCRARKIGAKGMESELTCAKPHDNAGKTQVFVAHATEFQASAFEAGTPEFADGDEPVVRGHFTEALLAALYGGAARAEGGVPAGQLWSFLSKVVPRIARRHQHEQSPKIVPFGIPPGDPAEPIFGAAKPVANVDVSITFTEARNGDIRLEGPDLEVIRQGDATTGPWDETLPVATYLLTEIATGISKDLHLLPSKGVFDVEF